METNFSYLPLNHRVDETICCKLNITGTFEHATKAATGRCLAK